jgi:hypothetical protein
VCSHQGEHSTAAAQPGCLINPKDTALCMRMSACLQSFGSPGVLVSTFGIVALGVASAFLA